jgi:hypothetical protein
MKNSTIELIYFTLIQLAILLVVVVYYQLNKNWKEKHKLIPEKQSTPQVVVGLDELVIN